MLVGIIGQSFAVVMKNSIFDPTKQTKQTRL